MGIWSIWGIKNVSFSEKKYEDVSVTFACLWNDTSKSAGALPAGLVKVITDFVQVITKLLVPHWSDTENRVSRTWFWCNWLSQT